MTDTATKFGNHTPTKVGSPARRGTHWTFEFPNGYGGSVIDDGYGNEEGLYELAVLHNGHLTYDTPITDDVLGWLTAGEVAETLDRIAALGDTPRDPSTGLLTL
jgi:hypothetical protein